MSDTEDEQLDAEERRDERHAEVVGLLATGHAIVVDDPADPSCEYRFIIASDGSHIALVAEGGTAIVVASEALRLALEEARTVRAGTRKAMLQ